MEELPCLTQLLHNVSAHQLGSAHLTTATWLQAHPEQLHTLHVMAHILLNVTQHAVDNPPEASAAPLANLQQALQQVAQAERLYAWSERVQTAQQHRAHQEKRAYGAALQQWLHQVEHYRHTQEVF
jgi:hypothetical protein